MLVHFYAHLTCLCTQSSDVADISVRQDVWIHEPVAIEWSTLSADKVLVLPYHATIYHQYHLRVTGGSQTYVWHSVDPSVATVDNHGVVSGIV